MASTILSDNGASSGSAGLKTTADSTGALALQTSTSGGTATTAITVDTSQNVGIGTASPSTKFHVYTSVAGNTPQTNAGTTALIENVSVTGSAGLKLRSGASAYPNYFTYDVSSGSTATMVFYDQAASAERMRIDSSGNLLVGTTTTGAANTQGLFLNSASGATYGSIGHVTGTGTGNGYLIFLYNGTNIGYISQNGTTAVAYNTTSDYRLKQNITPMTGALAKVAQLKPVTYKWKSDSSDGEGFIAHELAEVCPQAVTGEKDAVNEDGSIKPQGIDTSFLVATLTAAIQELKAINDTQAETITALTARIEALERK